jgi:organic hydroperoxide reductase OsmC/OhrA
MSQEHIYRIKMAWTGASQSPTYSREWTVEIEGKPSFVGSADPTFLGDSSLYNPEDLLVMALSSCHMLSYLALCARAGIRVLSYSDEAIGKMGKQNGKMGFIEVILYPKVVIEAIDDLDLEKARSLHKNAHRVCFIANSVSFPVLHEPTILDSSDPQSNSIATLRSQHFDLNRLNINESEN